MSFDPSISRRDMASVALALVCVAVPAIAAARGAFDFEFVAIDGKPMPLAAFRGKALLVVNTASYCDYTGQYDGLQALWDRYRARGLVVIGVPSNDFGNQEPGEESAIQEFCAFNFDLNFPMTRKLTVIGKDAHPFFQWIAAEMGNRGVPQWNFTKFLIAPDGAIMDVWPSRVEPLSTELANAIEAVLPEAQ
jgi:glutathione peroxidase